MSTASFWVIGDTSYSSSAATALSGYLNAVPPEVKFIVHVGDIWPGSNTSPALSGYQSVANLLKQSSVPVFIIPGDNETTDTTNPTLAFHNWTITFNHFDENWTHDIEVSHQVGREENFAFVLDETLYVGINLVGSGNDSQVLADDLAWIQSKFAECKDQVTCAVIFAQASPSESSTFEAGLIEAAQDFAEPILYLMGDKHEWQLDQPYDEAPNFTRVIIEATGSGSDSAPLLVRVSDDPTLPFTYDHDFPNAPVDEVAPQAPTIASFLPDGNALSGAAEAGSTVKVYDGATLLGTVTANGSGAWTLHHRQLADWRPQPHRDGDRRRRQRQRGLGSAQRHHRHGGAAAPDDRLVLDRQRRRRRRHHQRQHADAHRHGGGQQHGQGLRRRDPARHRHRQRQRRLELHHRRACRRRAQPHRDGDRRRRQRQRGLGRAQRHHRHGGRAAPAIASFSTDSGTAGDGITSDNTLTLTGTAEANSTVQVYDGATLLGTATANGSGAWSFTTGALADGAHSFTATRPMPPATPARPRRRSASPSTPPLRRRRRSPRSRPTAAPPATASPATTR